MFDTKSFNLIIVVTDGHSNKGEDPVMAALRAWQAGITVSTIGICDTGRLGCRGRDEVQRIAEAGGGDCYFAVTGDLAYTMHTLTTEAVRSYAEHTLNRHLRQILGVELKNMPPVIRAKILPVLRHMEDNLPLKLMLLVDTSGSMKPKRNALYQSIRDMLVSLAAHRGPVSLGIIRFPGTKSEAAFIKKPDWDNAFTSSLLQTLSFQGITPTGPAITAATKAMVYPGYEIGKSVRYSI
ncbi:VWA domain-containing protein [Phosphitispora sp. TUW77]|uniref:VWA domain-containing protein n=1 Tax=Phosphitispora sp. TUW77 TaxID=3152361 RepID=UPI003AB81D83